MGRRAASEVRSRLISTREVDDNAVVLDTTVTVPMQEEVVVELKKLGRIALRFAEYDRVKLRTAEVWLYESGEKIYSVTKFEPGTGEEDLVAEGLAPGRYEVEVTVGEAEVRFTVEVKGGETSVHEVRAP